jgi:hypothetical protein
MEAVHRLAMKNQWKASEVWQRELEQRFSSRERALAITDVEIRSVGQ